MTAGGDADHTSVELGVPTHHEFNCAVSATTKYVHVACKVSTGRSTLVVKHWGNAVLGW